MSKGKNWIQGAVKHPGALHKSLGIPQGQPIPASKLQSDPHDSTTMKRRKAFARTMKHINK